MTRMYDIILYLEKVIRGENMSLELSEKALRVKPSSTLEITARAKEMKMQGKDVVSFGAGEPDFNTPENICIAAKRAIDDGFTKYTPASGIMELKEALSKKFKHFNNIKYEPEQIVISNGGKHSLTNVFSAIINEGDEVIIPSPYWLSYPEIVMLAGGKPVIVRTEKSNSYKITGDDLEKAFTSKTKALILNSPNNPTGMIYSKNELQVIADFAVKNDIYVISDEIYENLCYGEENLISIASLNDEIYKRTITVNGLAKSYAMTGWRIGYTGSPLEIAKVMGSVQSHQTSNPNSIAQKAALEAISGDQTRVREMNAAFDERRKFIYERLCDIEGLSCIEPMGAFYIFVDASELIGKKYKGTAITSAADIARFLIEDFFVAIVPCADFGFPDHFRLSYAIGVSAIDKGMHRIKEFCMSLTD